MHISLIIPVNMSRGREGKEKREDRVKKGRNIRDENTTLICVTFIPRLFFSTF